MKSSYLIYACSICFISIRFIQGARRLGNGPISEALSLGQTMNTSREDCIWRMETDACSRTSVTFTLYTARSASSESTYDDESVEDVKIENIDISSPAWLHSSNWNPSYETIVLVHGYGGVSDTLPAGILRDAYLRNRTYNVIVVDWGPLAKLPCYIAAVHNMKAVAKCLAELFAFLRNSGVDMSKITCVGHSLGAHVCGVTSNYLNFRMHKIIGLDPAKPLVPNGSRAKLDTADAEMVQVLHTSSNYGDTKKAGHVDFYFNGGRIQPFCVSAADQELCSHTKSVCYLAESLFPSMIRFATKCRRRNVAIEDNPKGLFNRVGNAQLVPIGQATPYGVLGTYCVSNTEAPYCSLDKSLPGHALCCQSANPVPL